MPVAKPLIKAPSSRNRRRAILPPLNADYKIAAPARARGGWAMIGEVREDEPVQAKDLRVKAIELDA
jgi:hypothetical protein